MVKIVNGESIPNMPWQEKSQDNAAPLWRYTCNPIIQRDLLPDSNSIFNSAVVPFNGSYAGVFRCDNNCRIPFLHAGFSPDGIHWNIEPNPIRFECNIPGILPYEYAYDPRVCKLEEKYYITWCNGYRDLPTIGIAWTEDFKTYHQMENAFLPFNRNGVLFPRKINDKYCMLSRPSDNGHTPFGDIFYSESPDMVHWGCHRQVMKPEQSWEKLKIGAGPVPIETDEGWLLIYHGVLRSCSGFMYSMGAALLDLEKPYRVIARAKSYLMSPRELYECVGDVNNVVFPCATICDQDTGRLAVYYGCADTVTGLAFGRVEDIIRFVKENNTVGDSL